MGSASRIRAALEETPAVDQHAHLLASVGAEPPLTRVLSETDDADQLDQVRHTVSYQRALRDLAAFAQCEPDEEALVRQRNEVGAEEWARRLFAASRLSAVFVDDGFEFPGSAGLDRLESVADCPVGRVLRLESAAEAVVPGSTDLGEARECFRAVVREGLDRGAVALKTVAAYRSGLSLGPAEPDAIAASYERWRQQGFGRLSDPVLVSFFLIEALDVIRADPVPVQVHTGLGDPDIDLRLADPLLLAPLLSGVGRDVPFVLLHCYPYVAQASYLAATYPSVHLDLSLAMTLVSHRGPDLVLDALQQAPATKLLFGTDASRLPEAFFLGARWWRRSLSLALGLLVDDGSITEKVAMEWSRLILAGNAERLYACPPEPEREPEPEPEREREDGAGTGAGGADTGAGGADRVSRSAVPLGALATQSGDGPAAGVSSTEAPTGGGPSARSRPSASGAQSPPARRRWLRRRRDRPPVPPQPRVGGAGAEPGHGSEEQDPSHG